MCGQIGRGKINGLGVAILALLVFVAGAWWVTRPSGRQPDRGRTDAEFEPAAPRESRVPTGAVGPRGGEPSSPAPSRWDELDPSLAFMQDCVRGWAPTPILSPYTGGLEAIYLGPDGGIATLWSDCWACSAELDVYPSPRLRPYWCSANGPREEWRPPTEEELEVHFARVEALRLW